MSVNEERAEEFLLAAEDIFTEVFRTGCCAAIRWANADRWRMRDYNEVNHRLFALIYRNDGINSAFWFGDTIHAGGTHREKLHRVNALILAAYIIEDGGL